MPNYDEGEFSIDKYKKNAQIKINTHRKKGELIDTIFHEMTHLVLRKFYDLTTKEEEIIAYMIGSECSKTIEYFAKEVKEM
jgi:hypothetical protein